ncbi:MAG TPA: hypothetical protein PKZ41_02780, partial [Candidatus Omnitrophota bacterium]|nr:hypothetical protein [Candidatus Omnitrophota bacterium]
RDFNEEANSWMLTRMLSVTALQDYYAESSSGDVKQTIDRVKFPVFGNINLPLSTDRAVGMLDSLMESGADGVGLVRTEYMYDGVSAPTEAQQVELYSALAEKAGDKIVTFRTFDKVDDKECPALPVEDGRRSFDYYRTPAGKEAFTAQLRALYKAALRHENIRIMFPMVKDISDIEFIASVARENGMSLDRVSLGIMIETRELLEDGNGDLFGETGSVSPVNISALALKAILSNQAVPISFVSVGSNDLTSAVKGKPRTDITDDDFDKEMLVVLEGIAIALRQEYYRRVESEDDMAELEEREPRAIQPVTMGICGDAAKFDITFLFSLYLYKTHGVLLTPSAVSSVIPRRKALIPFTNAEGWVTSFDHGWWNRTEEEIAGMVRAKVDKVIGKIRKSPGYIEMIRRKVSDRVGMRKMTGALAMAGFGGEGLKVFGEKVSELMYGYVPEHLDSVLPAMAILILLGALAWKAFWTAADTKNEALLEEQLTELSLKPSGQRRWPSMVHVIGVQTSMTQAELDMEFPGFKAGGVDILALPEGKTNEENLLLLEAARRERNTVWSSYVDASALEAAGGISSLGRVALDMTREIEKRETEKFLEENSLEEIESLRSALEGILKEMNLPAMLPEIGLLSLYNLRITDRARSGMPGWLDATTQSYIEREDKESLVHVTVSSLAEVKTQAEAFRLRDPRKLKLRVTLAVGDETSEDELAAMKTGKAALMKSMDVDKLIGEGDLEIVRRSDIKAGLTDATMAAIQSARSTGGDVISVDRVEDAGNQANQNLPKGVLEMRYNQYATADVFDTALRVLARGGVVGDIASAIGLDPLTNGVIMYLREIKPEDMGTLKAEFERYREILTRA